jgi:hypothetical protein
MIPLLPTTAVNFAMIGFQSRAVDFSTSSILIWGNRV